ncbi:MAG: hypothetical protein ACTSXL_02735 [Alphaproteobacteria bacterium]|nr:MAG: hypothetical protein B6I23_03560 [Rickettsiaceae bacterium 4572_127]
MNKEITTVIAPDSVVSRLIVDNGDYSFIPNKEIAEFRLASFDLQYTLVPQKGSGLGEQQYFLNKWNNRSNPDLELYNLSDEKINNGKVPENLFNLLNIVGFGEESLNSSLEHIVSFLVQRRKQEKAILTDKYLEKNIKLIEIIINKIMSLYCDKLENKRVEKINYNGSPLVPLIKSEIFKTAPVALLQLTLAYQQ